MERVKSGYDLEIGVVRKALKTLCPTLSVRKGTGTAYSWIEIGGSGEFGNFTEQERQALEKFGLGYGANSTGISGEDRRHYVEKAAKMMGVELPPELKKGYAERDAYRQEMERKAEEMRRLRESCPHEWERLPYVVFPSGTAYKCKKCKLEEVRQGEAPEKTAARSKF